METSPSSILHPLALCTGPQVEGLYDIHIHLKHIPFLETEVPIIAERHEIVAGQVMSTKVKCLRPVERVGINMENTIAYADSTCATCRWLQTMLLIAHSLLGN